MKRVTIDTNIVGAALKKGQAFREKVQEGTYQVFVAEATLTLNKVARK